LEHALTPPATFDGQKRPPQLMPAAAATRENEEGWWPAVTAVIFIIFSSKSRLQFSQKKITPPKRYRKQKQAVFFSFGWPRSDVPSNIGCD
jgi:hypothetical protein